MDRQSGLYNVAMVLSAVSPIGGMRDGQALRDSARARITVEYVASGLQDLDLLGGQALKDPLDPFSHLHGVEGLAELESAAADFGGIHGHHFV
jgi:hypothetical protein